MTDYSSETDLERQKRLARHIRGVPDDVLGISPDDDTEPEPSNRLTDQEFFQLTEESRSKYGPTHPLNQPPPPELGEDPSVEDFEAHINRPGGI